jgi:hypothetical protein
MMVQGQGGEHRLTSARILDHPHIIMYEGHVFAYDGSRGVDANGVHAGAV